MSFFTFNNLVEFDKLKDGRHKLPAEVVVNKMGSSLVIDLKIKLNLKRKKGGDLK